MSPALLLPYPLRSVDWSLPGKIRPRIQPVSTRPGSSHEPNHDRRSPQKSRLPHRPRRQMASGQRAEIPSATTRLRRILRIPRRCHTAISNEQRHAARHRTSQRAKSISPMPSAARPSRLHRAAQRRALFLYLAFNAVHTPMDATDDRLQEIRQHRGQETPHLRRDDVGAWTKTSAAVLDKFDETGRNRKHLRHLHQRQRRPDHAGHHDQRLAATTRCAAGKRTTLEGGIRVPFVVSWQRTHQTRRLRQHGHSTRPHRHRP